MHTINGKKFLKTECTILKILHKRPSFDHQSYGLMSQTGEYV